ncbi:histidine phosphatase family protein [Enterococcus dongliensis]|uniref:phosphoglycerate mutase (2,3-diphosphoglycerate-dependent) n=1 Tax=Enterococcus dongliensis TaxID=2559925 RepID=A0AAP5KQ65_9ENTE|nr:histidine phosphatase family protein [Enterococcus dongliensis]MDT2596247.1 histidine phosphatase family protein [Enterococcus dongliensis]MDT2604623.1 histidine phosphatase family protein [Enterococcus dongliensis]MDT2634834.1 histidine phosphatase family protein [Enterococcus dongliensis]MDT2637869.1 histidine phosphatase family protein [Enterococcus dongliensis]MDT2639271.1 histidine phosphatase family protein [Enterococcus dongliensis]
MKLYFTRHGKTRWNQEKRFQGMMGDSPLLPESKAAIKALGTELKEIPFEKIYTSSLKRAYLTAEGINKQLTRPTEIVRSEDLRELGLGKLEGQLIPAIMERYPEDMVNLRHHLDLYDPTPFDGEKIEDMLKRINDLVEKAVEESQEGPLLFVGHGAALTAAVQALIGKPLSELRAMGGLFNNSLTILEATSSKPPYELIRWNDVSFLEGIGSKPDSLL